MTSVIGTPRFLERAARHLGGPRVLALPLLRVLAIVLGAVWVALAPATEPGRGAAALVVGGFALYSAILIGALWRWPTAVLQCNLLVLLADVAFALVIIGVTGTAHSALFLALLAIAGVQSYFYGIERGVAVGVLLAVLYVAVAWPTLAAGGEWANLVVRVAMLLGAALGIGILADLESTERLRVAALTSDARTREQFFTGVVESLTEGLVALDPAGRIVTWNAAMAQRKGIPRAEALGRRLIDVFGKNSSAAWAPSLGRLLAGEIAEFALDGVELETPRGRAVANFKASRLHDGGVVLLVEDITERVGLERSARQAEKLASLGTLAAGIAHELNNPIGVISSRVELMLLEAQSEGLSEDVRRDLQVVHRHAQRVARIAAGLLSFARQSPRERGAVDINRVVEDTLLLVEKSITREGLVLRRALAPGLPPVWGDANALQQVLVNLLTNARDALGDAGEISVTTSAAPRAGVRVVVRDTGRGIPPEALPRIFDPFFTTKADGTGLGLSISYGIVRDHQGTVDVQSRAGEGTTFTLTFPAHAARVNA